MSGRYAINGRDAFSRTRQGRGLDLRNASGHRPARQSASGRGQDQGRTLFGCAETDIYAPMEIIEKAESVNEGANARSRSIRHPSRASRFRSGRFTIATPPSGIGTAARALSVATLYRSHGNKMRLPRFFRTSTTILWLSEIAGAGEKYIRCDHRCRRHRQRKRCRFASGF